MSATHKDSITLIAGEDLEPYRRVKYHSSAGQVVYADASDGDGWIGVTKPGADGDYVASGGEVAVELRGENKTLKVMCSAAVTANASLYPENDGKVSDDAGTVIIGTCAGTDTGAASSYIEFHPNGGSGSVTNDSNVAAVDGTSNGSVCLIYRKSGVTASAASTAVFTPGRAVVIWDILIKQLGSTATEVTMKNGATAFTDAVAVNTTAGKMYRPTTYTAAQLAVTAGATVYASLATADATGVDIMVIAQPTA
jgi:hypothetical protein